MATAAEIRDRVLRRLGVLAIGQTANASAADLADTAYSEYYAELSRLGIAAWAYTSDVPDMLSEYVVNGVAKRLLNDFSVSNERYQRIISDSATAESNIRRLVGNEFVYKPVDILDY